MLLLPTSVAAHAPVLSAPSPAPPSGKLYSSAIQLSPSQNKGVGVDDLWRLCILRLSIVKGWDPDYRHHNIKKTPCLVEIQLHHALQLLDNVLYNMPTENQIQEEVAQVSAVQ